MACLSWVCSERYSKTLLKPVKCLTATSEARPSPLNWVRVFVGMRHKSWAKQNQEHIKTSSKEISNSQAAGKGQSTKQQQIQQACTGCLHSPCCPVCPDPEGQQEPLPAPAPQPVPAHFCAWGAFTGRHPSLLNSSYTDDRAQTVNLVETPEPISPCQLEHRPQFFSLLSFLAQAPGAGFLGCAHFFQPIFRLSE